VRPTLDIVAARAGVSRATASRVLRGAANVSDSALRAVLDAAADVAYSPNRAARSLVTRRSDSVAFVVAESEDRIFSDPYFLGMLRGAHAVVSAAGLQLLFVLSASEQESESFAQFATAGHVDGVLLISLHADNKLLRELTAAGVPTIVNGRPIADDGAIWSVDSDNVAGARSATQVLVDRGANRIATITGPQDMSPGVDRLAGYQQALRANGMRVLRQHQVLGDFSLDGGARAMRQLLARDTSIDAVFVASDLMALGAMGVIASAGLSVPGDIAVVGFDDIPQAGLATPGLTTVRQPIEEVGRMMATRLLQLVDGITVDRTTVLPVQVIRRSSA
jgi:DNA-binding LacI/PurR family transcriptional regulator